MLRKTLYDKPNALLLEKRIRKTLSKKAILRFDKPGFSLAKPSFSLINPFFFSHVKLTLSPKSLNCQINHKNVYNSPKTRVRDEEKNMHRNIGVIFLVIGLRVNDI